MNLLRQAREAGATAAVGVGCLRRSAVRGGFGGLGFRVWVLEVWGLGLRGLGLGLGDYIGVILLGYWKRKQKLLCRVWRCRFQGFRV